MYIDSESIVRLIAQNQKIHCIDYQSRIMLYTSLNLLFIAQRKDNRIDFQVKSRDVWIFLEPFIECAPGKYMHLAWLLTFLEIKLHLEIELIMLAGLESPRLIYNFNRKVTCSACLWVLK